MIQKKIEHPFRTITLQYDETQPGVPELEEKMVNKLIEVHDKMHELYAPCNQLIYEYIELVYAIEEANKNLIPIGEEIDRIFNQVQYECTQKDAEFRVQEIFEIMNPYLPIMNDYHDKHVNAIEEEYNRLYNLYVAFDEKRESYSYLFEELLDVSVVENIKDLENFSLDYLTFDNEEQLFYEKVEELDNKIEKINPINAEYSKWVEFLNDKWDKWKEANEIILSLYKADDSLDRSLSESFLNGKGDKNKMPNYFLPPDYEKVLKLAEECYQLGYSQTHTLTITATKDVVEERNVYFIQEFIMCLQHYPNLIKKLAFSISIDILDQFGEPMNEDQWKGHKLPIMWYHQMATLPVTIFFLSDSDARGYVLMGDLLEKKKDTIDGDEYIKFEGEEVDVLCNRLFDACWMFMAFCHNTGFDPENEIKALLADFDLPVTYERIKEHFDKDVVKGLSFKAKKYKN